MPERKRQYGYYVYPFLLGEDLVARVDLKADNRAGRLIVKAAYLERGHVQEHVARSLVSELQLMADWLGLTEIKIGRGGDLNDLLRAKLKLSD